MGTGLMEAYARNHRGDFRVFAGRNGGTSVCSSIRGAEMQ
ncbi:hypothetical protein A33K_18999 [Burkholderia humptydooensis MSMB43]|uniref:Uncharacterized protein n=1 Tax=Burkholderia humptydooensis MSMB43 TaxID=441157 RepID=A0ABN0FWJ4_9BURK|nr:hypothetical protein A33K_18999 [Burkholderia humptydooensis MSMB43]